MIGEVGFFWRGVGVLNNRHTVVITNREELLNLAKTKTHLKTIIIGPSSVYGEKVSRCIFPQGYAAIFLNLLSMLY
jgi:hypothetical protein